MRVLVTGAGGFIGQEVVKQLYNEKHDVVGLDLHNTCIGINKPPIYYLDITEYTLLYEMMRGKPDVVVHLAACVAGKPSIEKPHMYYYVNILGTLNVLEAMRQCGVKHLVYVSSWSTYGSQPHLPITEFTQQEPENPYGVSKWCAEQIVKNYCSLYGIKAVILRPTIIYGPNQTEQNVVQQVVGCMVSGNTFEVYGSGEHTREFLYVTDASKVIVNTTDYVTRMGAGLNYRLFVVGTGNPIRIIDLVTMAQNIKHFPVTFKQAKSWSFSQSSHIDRTKRLLSWEPLVDLEIGLKKVWEWRLSES